MSPLQEVADFQHFRLQKKQNLVSKITNSDKSKTPQFRQQAISGCFFIVVSYIHILIAFHFSFLLLQKLTFQLGKLFQFLKFYRHQLFHF